jgi:hypothetical protein
MMFINDRAAARLNPVFYLLPAGNEKNRCKPRIQLPVPEIVLSFEKDTPIMGKSVDRSRFCGTR